MKLKDPSLLQTRCLIDGQWLDADSGKTIAVTNPATGETIAHVPDMGAAETRRAIDAAETARAAWQKKTAKQRAAILRRWFELLTEHTDDLAVILSTEQGKPLAEARGEIAYGASYLAWYAEEALRLLSISAVEVAFKELGGHLVRVEQAAAHNRLIAVAGLTALIVQGVTNTGG